MSCPPAPAAAEFVVRRAPPPRRARARAAQRRRLQLRRRARAHFARRSRPERGARRAQRVRYLPCSPLLIRGRRACARPVDVLLACAAALTAGAHFELSVDETLARTRPVPGRDRARERAHRVGGGVCGAARGLHARSGARRGRAGAAGRGARRAAACRERAGAAHRAHRALALLPRAERLAPLPPLRQPGPCPTPASPARLRRCRRVRPGVGGEV